MLNRLALLTALLLVVTPCLAQELPVLDPGYTRLITQEISGDAAYEHIRFQSQFHRPTGGADGLWAVAQYIEAKAGQYGLTDVSLIRQDYSGTPWNASFADLWIVQPGAERLASTLQSPLHLADYSRPADVTAQLVDVGGGADEDFAGVDVAGKIVLTYGSVGGVMRRAVGAGGALGLIVYPNPLNGEGAFPDKLHWVRVPRQDSTYEPTFAFNLSVRQGLALRSHLAAADSPVVVHAVVQSAFNSSQGDQPWQVMVEGFIRGSDPNAGQDILLTGHMQEEATSANDDASGCASVLEIARALNRLIEEGRLPRPKRDIRFWWTTEISSERQYFADHPDAPAGIWVDINQDMVGADQSQDVMRVQNITRLPATRFHFFNDVVEAVIDYMVAANTSELAALQAGTGFYPDPSIAHLGTRDRYNAKMIFFHNNTDHMTFTEAPIGIPGVTFTNWPDEYIHSSDDDLWNVDRTQLGRNAAAVALIAYTMATADAGAVPALAAETVGRGEGRLADNVRLGLTWIAAAGDKGAAYDMAADQVRYAVQRERLAIASLAQIDPTAQSLVDPLLAELEARGTQALDELAAAYTRATGNDALPQRQLSATERQLDAMTPVLVGGPREFLERRGEIDGVRGLHSLMAFEILNSVNGESTGLDIYRYVSAEAREAGAYYYGVVTPDAVLQYLENAAAAGLVAGTSTTN